MGLFSRSAVSKEGSTSSADDAAYTHNTAEKAVPAGAVVGDDGIVYDEDLHVPAHTTEAKITRRIDLHVIPVLCILYLLAFLDRVNISNARSFGLEDDLGMNKNSLQFSTAVVIFFVPYILFEIPSNILLKKFRPRVWLSLCMFGFGLMTIIQGLVQNYGGLLTVRFFLGIFETGMFPGCFYLIGMWYRRAEAQKRFSFFFSSTTLAGAFGGLLAAAIAKMSGIRGYSGWRWIFILEGLLTCLVAILFFFIMSDFPEEAKWLRSDERAYIKKRLEVDQGKSARDRKVTFTDVKNVLTDPKVLLTGLMYFGLIIPAYSYAYFAPLIISSFNYSPIQTQLHSVPPWAAAFGFSMVIAYFSDRMRHRFLFAMIPICVAITGFAILLGARGGHQHLSYGALHLITSGVYSAMPIIVCWGVLNLGGHHRRAIGTAWLIGFGNIGGIVASFSFQPKDKPTFTPGYSICIAFVIFTAAVSLLYLLLLVRDNRRRAKMPTDLSLSEEQKAELGDLNTEYRYQY